MEQRLLDDIAETAGYATIALRCDLSIVHVDRNAARILGPGRAPFEGRNIADVFTGALSYAGSLIGDAVASGLPRTEKKVAIGDAACRLTVTRGANYWIVRISDETSTLADLYRLREIEAEFHQLRALMLTALNGVSVGIIIVDADGQARYVNRFTREHIGDTFELSDVESFAEAAGIYEADGETIRPVRSRTLIRALRGETVIDDRLVVKNTMTIRPLAIRASATPFRNKAGEIVGAVGWFYVEGEAQQPEGKAPAATA